MFAPARVFGRIRYLSKHKKHYCAFIDYRSAFDKIKRPELWQKLISNGINGPILRVIYNLYSEAKSAVMTGDKLTELFPCTIGVRQGENLSPSLFALFVNDLRPYLSHKVKGLKLLGSICNDLKKNQLNTLENIFILMYADDTIILAESPSDLQLALNTHNIYCQKWGLCVNAQKTKIVVSLEANVTIVNLHLAQMT